MLGKLGIIQNGAVVIQDDIIIAVGESAALLNKYPDEPRFDARGRVVMPGFVDPHTHLPWVGNRANEYEMRLMGKSYMEIMAAGGGINSTVTATRLAIDTQLHDETRERASSIFKHGTTTAEAKTGYGLTLDVELRLLKGINDP